MNSSVDGPRKPTAHQRSRRQRAERAQRYSQSNISGDTTVFEGLTHGIAMEPDTAASRADNGSVPQNAPRTPGSRPRSEATDTDMQQPPTPTRSAPWTPSGFRFSTSTHNEKQDYLKNSIAMLSGLKERTRCLLVALEEMSTLEEEVFLLSEVASCNKAGVDLFTKLLESMDGAERDPWTVFFEKDWTMKLECEKNLAEHYEAQLQAARLLMEMRDRTPTAARSEVVTSPSTSDPTSSFRPPRSEAEGSTLSATAADFTPRQQRPAANSQNDSAQVVASRKVEPNLQRATTKYPRDGWESKLQPKQVASEASSQVTAYVCERQQHPQPNVTQERQRYHQRPQNTHSNQPSQQYANYEGRLQHAYQQRSNRQAANVDNRSHWPQQYVPAPPPAYIYVRSDQAYSSPDWRSQGPRQLYERRPINYHHDSIQRMRAQTVTSSRSVIPVTGLTRLPVAQSEFVRPVTFEWERVWRDRGQVRHTKSSETVYPPVPAYSNQPEEHAQPQRQFQARRWSREGPAQQEASPQSAEYINNPPPRSRTNTLRQNDQSNQSSRTYRQRTDSQTWRLYNQQHHNGSKLGSGAQFPDFDASQHPTDVPSPIAMPPPSFHPSEMYRVFSRKWTWPLPSPVVPGNNDKAGQERQSPHRPRINSRTYIHDIEDQADREEDSRGRTRPWAIPALNSETPVERDVSLGQSRDSTPWPVYVDKQASEGHDGAYQGHRTGLSQSERSMTPAERFTEAARRMSPKKEQQRAMSKQQRAPTPPSFLLQEEQINELQRRRAEQSARDKAANSANSSQKGHGKGKGKAKSSASEQSHAHPSPDSHPAHEEEVNELSTKSMRPTKSNNSKSNCSGQKKTTDQRASDVAAKKIKTERNRAKPQKEAKDFAKAEAQQKDVQPAKTQVTRQRSAQQGKNPHAARHHAKTITETQAEISQIICANPPNPHPQSPVFTKVQYNHHGHLQLEHKPQTPQHTQHQVSQQVQPADIPLPDDFPELKSPTGSTSPASTLMPVKFGGWAAAAKKGQANAQASAMSAAASRRVSIESAVSPDALRSTQSTPQLRRSERTASATKPTASAAARFEKAASEAHHSPRLSIDRNAGVLGPSKSSKEDKEHRRHSSETAANAGWGESAEAEKVWTTMSATASPAVMRPKTGGGPISWSDIARIGLGPSMLRIGTTKDQSEKDVPHTEASEVGKNRVPQKQGTKVDERQAAEHPTKMVPTSKPEKSGERLGG